MHMALRVSVAGDLPVWKTEQRQGGWSQPGPECASGMGGREETQAGCSGGMTCLLTAEPWQSRANARAGASVSGGAGDTGLW